MQTFHVKYDEVHTETARLRNHLSSNMTTQANTEYRQIQSQLGRVDGATNANLREAMNVNRTKTLEAANVLDRLLQFITNSARQIEVSEQQMARTMTGGRR